MLGVADLMQRSLDKLAAAGANLLIFSDDTIQSCPPADELSTGEVHLVDDFFKIHDYKSDQRCRCCRTTND